MPAPFRPLLAVLLCALALSPARAHFPPEALRRAFPGAEAFGPLEGEPPAVVAYRAGEAVGWVFSTWLVVRSTGYGGAKLDLLAGLDPKGRITGVAVLEQNEPILLTGRDRRDLEAFLAAYVGRDVRAPIEVGRGAGAKGGIDALSGATITSLVLHDALLRSARAVARAKGLLGSAGRLDLERFEPASWGELEASGALVRLRLSNADAEAAFARRGGRLFPEAMGRLDPNALFLELWAGLATPPLVLRNLLGEKAEARLRGRLAADDQILFLAARGLAALTGPGWRRGERLERLALVQGGRTIVLAPSMLEPIESLAVSGAPELRERFLLVLPAASGFRAEEPWRLQLLLPSFAEPEAKVLFELPYAPPPLLLRPLAQAPAEPAWVGVWRARVFDLALLAAGLVLLAAILTFQPWIVRRRRLWRGLRLAFLLYTVVFIGYWAKAQLSIVNVLTFGRSLLSGFSWDLFLLEPLIFVLWTYVALALVFLGRGVYCGWLCPFGALQEFAAEIARRLRLPELVVPFALHERLRAVKFAVLLLVLGLSLGSLEQAVLAARIEPFETAIVRAFRDELPHVAWALFLLAAGLFVPRAFCRYLCPLGAALALPARLRQFEWLERRWQCGQKCRICEIGCPVQAIHPDGEIHPGECIYCLRCQVNFWDDRLCPPLIERRARAERREALARTARPRPGTADEP
ncbi:MAG: 4Fe-4S binding protein [Geminicoccaceae bacterium]|nr:4Fe-4S binding protein [Geminicoccaceae bacterium]MCS7269323.1 4Fe-4S binding protein [Geminicoccaceae bacterium]MCX7630218.1 4Fe-4S binding protein [Geminicoccaceae bacterium]MDW8125499.1 4Fe-4S binding protein [Geminicoccaceae bacterium]MDW8341432.1 4Fe-4S binding protein [Geminicoccaceae bacterium]